MLATGAAGPQITLPIPTRRPVSWAGNYVSVPADVVLAIVDVLRCYLALWKPPPDLEARSQATSALAGSASGALDTSRTLCATSFACQICVMKAPSRSESTCGASCDEKTRSW